MVGNLFDLDLNKPIQSLVQIAGVYGPIFSLKVPTEDLVVISSRALAHEACDETRFQKKVHGPLELVRDFAGDGLITAHTPEKNWEKAHRILMPAFGTRALRGMFPAMLDLAEQLVLKWERHGPSHTVDLSDEMTRLTVDTIALCGFNYRLNSFYSETLHPFVGAMVGGLTESSARTRRIPFLNPLLWRKKRQYAADISVMHGLADEIIATRRREGIGHTGDVLDLMLAAKDPRTGETLDDVNIRHQMVTFLIAGHETTSGLLSFAIYELLKQPAVLARAREHVDDVLRGRTPTFDSLPTLTYLDQILKETLRLWPTAPAFAVRPFESTTLGGTFPVEPHQTLLFLLPAIQRDPVVWADPERFDPDRMERTRFDQLPPDAWKPFGNGQRSCIGQAFAMQEATLALALILQRFELAFADPNFELRIRESLTLKPDDLRVRVSLRAKPLAPAVDPRTETRSGPATAASDLSLRIFFGSKRGTAEGYASELAAQAHARGARAEVSSLERATPTLARDAVSVIITSSYDGLPPENARSFVETLANAQEGTARGSRFAVFGCGDRNWARTFQAVPKFIDRRLHECGADRILPRGEGDARSDSAGEFARWSSSLWDALGKEMASTGAASQIAISAETAALCERLGGDPTLASKLAQLPLARPATLSELELLVVRTPCPPEKMALRERFAAGPASLPELLAMAHSCRISFDEWLDLYARGIVSPSTRKMN